MLYIFEAGPLSHTPPPDPSATQYMYTIWNSERTITMVKSNPEGVAFNKHPGYYASSTFIASAQLSKARWKQCL